MNKAETEQQTTEAATEPVESQPPEAPAAPATGEIYGLRPDVREFARFAVHSGLAPAGIDTESKAVIALQMGHELKMTPMASLQSIAVIKGRPKLWGDAMLGLCQRHPTFVHGSFHEWFTGTEGQDDWTAHTKVQRAGGVVVERTFSVADAKRAGLWTKDTYQQYPQRLLKYRARAFSLRDSFADILMGLHMVEEMTAEAVLDQIDLTPEQEGSAGERVARTVRAARASAPAPGPAEPQVDPVVPEVSGVVPKVTPATPPPVLKTSLKTDDEPPALEFDRDEYIQRLGDVVGSLTDAVASKLRGRFGVLSLTDGDSLRKLKDDDLKSLTMAAETRVRKGK